MVILLCFWLHGQAVKTQPSHGCNRGSNPLGVTNKEEICQGFLFCFPCCCNRLHAAAQMGGSQFLCGGFYINSLFWQSVALESIIHPALALCRRACHLLRRAILPPRPTILPYHRRAYAITAAPALCRHACFTIMCCSATSADAEPVLPPNYRRACTSLRHVLLRRVYFLLPRLLTIAALCRCACTITVTPALTPRFALPLRLLRSHAEHLAPRPHYRCRTRP